MGEYQFNLYEQLDHTGANDDSLTFSLPVYAVTGVQTCALPICNGVRTYEGFIELDGVRITVFDVAIDAPALANVSTMIDVGSATPIA